MARTDAQRIAASGRTLEEHHGHRQVPQDRSARQPHGQARLRKRRFFRLERQAPGKRLFGGDPERYRAHRHESLPFRDQARRPCFAGLPRRTARLVQRSFRGGHLVRLFHLPAEGFRAAARAWALCWRNGTTRPNLAIHPASRRSLSAIWTALCASRARFRKSPPRIRTSDTCSMRFAKIAHEAWLDFVFRIHWSRHGDSSIDAFLDGQKTIPLRRAAWLPQRDKGPVFQARRLCERAKSAARWSPTTTITAAPTASRRSIRASSTRPTDKA